MFDGPVDDLTFVVLAGGYSRRFDYQIKALQEFQGESLLTIKMRMLSAFKSKSIISVGSDDVREQCASSLTNDNIDLSKTSFIKDNEYDQGPMKALFDIIPLIQTNYALVIGVDNIMIGADDIKYLIEKFATAENADIMTVSINNQRIVSSFFGFRVKNVRNAIESIPHANTFERLTDLFRIVNRILILDNDTIGQFINVNTPEELQNLSYGDYPSTPFQRMYDIKPQYYLKTNVDCVGFKTEIASWSDPEINLHVKENIIRDAKNLLGLEFENCDL